MFEKVLKFTNKLLPSPVPLGTAGADRLADAIIFESGLVEQAFSVHDRAYADGAPWFNTSGAEEDAVEDLHAPHLPVASEERSGDRGAKFLHDGDSGEGPTAAI